jgi:hypothetical protein
MTTPETVSFDFASQLKAGRLMNSLRDIGILATVRPDPNKRRSYSLIVQVTKDGPESTVNAVRAIQTRA